MRLHYFIFTEQKAHKNLSYAIKVNVKKMQAECIIGLRPHIRHKQFIGLRHLA